MLYNWGQKPVTPRSGGIERNEQEDEEKKTPHIFSLFWAKVSPLLSCLLARATIVAVPFAKRTDGCYQRRGIRGAVFRVERRILLFAACATDPPAQLLLFALHPLDAHDTETKREA